MARRRKRRRHERSEPYPAVDWPAIAGDVARALLGDPNPRLSTERDLRYGTKGSLSVRVDQGTWHDFEADIGGGVLALVERECGDRGRALDWLQSSGFLPRSSGSGPCSPPPALARPVPVSPSTSVTDEALALARSEIVARIWGSVVAADPTPARVYLAQRLAWPPVGIGPDLPGTVGWLSREVAPGRFKLGRWPGLPSTAAGALVFAWRRPGDTDGHVGSVTSMAMSEAGERLAWWDKAGGPATLDTGSPRGLAFEATPGVPGSVLHLVEGEVDALALALAPWVPGVRVLCVGGTSGLKRVGTLGLSGPLVLHVDGDQGGREATLDACASLRDAGGDPDPRIDWYGAGEDPASALACDVLDRAASLEVSGGLSRDDAQREAWRRLLEQGVSA